MRNKQPNTDGALDRDAEWLVDLIETDQAGGIDIAVENLEWLLGRLKRASKARRALARASERQWRAAISLRSEQAEANT